MGAPYIPGNISQLTWQDYTPSLIGATDNPVATYGTRVGRFALIGNLCFYSLFVTTTTMTKTTLTDALRITLPFTAATVAGAVWGGTGRVENSTPIANAVLSEVASATAYLTYRAIPVTTASLPITYAVASPGIGVLTNTITFTANGVFEV